MTYIEGFLTAVPTANKAAYVAHAERASAMIREFGATRFVEAWGDDVPRGKVNDLWMAVQAADDETVLFSWFEYPDKATRDAANARMMEDPRMAEMGKDMPFDGSRMIYGGFDVVHEAGDGASGGTAYVDGFVLAVSSANKDAYVDMARKASAVFRDHGASRVVEAWGDDVPTGKVTDYARAIRATGDDIAVYAWVEWPSKDVRDAGMKAVNADERMQTPHADMPFDAKRAMFGGFSIILDI